MAIEDVIRIGQATNESLGHTVGDALGAYGAVQKLQQGKQELEMKKQENEMSKANWLASQVKAIQSSSGPARQLLSEGFMKQAQTVFPGANQDNFKALAKDPELTQAALMGMQKFADGTAGAEDLKNIAPVLSQQTPEFIDTLKQIAHNKAMVAASQLKNASMVDVRQQQVDNTTHKDLVNTVVNNPLTKQMLASVQNLNNAKSNFLAGGSTPQEFAEMQQAVRANLGIKGQSGVNERTETYLKSSGISRDSFVQFLTGNPQSIMESDPKFANVILGLVDTEIKNKSKQARAMIERDSMKYQSFYKHPRNKDRAVDFENTKNATLAQFGAGEPSTVDGQTVVHDGVTYKAINGQWVEQK